MKSLEWIRKGLADRRVSIVMSHTGLSRNAIVNIRDGKETNPKLKTIERLSAYLVGEGE